MSTAQKLAVTSIVLGLLSLFLNLFAVALRHAEREKIAGRCTEAYRHTFTAADSLAVVRSGCELPTEGK